MRKPLELTVFEKEPGRYGREPLYNSPDGFWAYPASHVDGYAANKHLTDAELAAEWQYQDNRCGQVVEGYGVAHDGTYMESEEVEIERLATVYRFATIPSYDEVA